MSQNKSQLPSLPLNILENFSNRNIENRKQAEKDLKIYLSQISSSLLELYHPPTNTNNNSNNIKSSLQDLGDHQAQAQSKFNLLLNSLKTKTDLSNSPSIRKGVFVCLAFLASTLPKQTQTSTQQIIQIIETIEYFFLDNDSKIVAIAGESLYSILKFHSEILPKHFSLLFNCLIKIVSNQDPDVKLISKNIDFIIKEIINYYFEDVYSSNSDFDLEGFVRGIYVNLSTPNYSIKYLVVSWITFINSLPEINLVNVLYEFVPMLFDILENSVFIVSMSNGKKNYLGEARKLLKNGGSVGRRRNNEYDTNKNRVSRVNKENSGKNNNRYEDTASNRYFKEDDIEGDDAEEYNYNNSYEKITNIKDLLHSNFDEMYKERCDNDDNVSYNLITEKDDVNNNEENKNINISSSFKNKNTRYKSNTKYKNNNNINVKSKNKKDNNKDKNKEGRINTKTIEKEETSNNNNDNNNDNNDNLTNNTNISNNTNNTTNVMIKNKNTTSILLLANQNPTILIETVKATENLIDELFKDLESKFDTLTSEEESFILEMLIKYGNNSNNIVKTIVFEWLIVFLENYQKTSVLLSQENSSNYYNRNNFTSDAISIHPSLVGNMFSSVGTFKNNHNLNFSFTNAYITNNISNTEKKETLGIKDKEGKDIKNNDEKSNNKSIYPFSININKDYMNNSSNISNNNNNSNIKDSIKTPTINNNGSPHQNLLQNNNPVTLVNQTASTTPRQIPIKYLPNILDIIIKNICNSNTNIRKFASKANEIFKSIIENYSDFKSHHIQLFEETLKQHFTTKSDTTLETVIYWINKIFKKINSLNLTTHVKSFLNHLISLLNHSNELIFNNLLNNICEIGELSKELINVILSLILKKLRNTPLLLEAKGKIILKRLCNHLVIERLLVTLADVLYKDSDIRFVTKMISIMDVIILSSSESGKIKKLFVDGESESSNRGNTVNTINTINTGDIGNNDNNVIKNNNNLKTNTSISNDSVFSNNFFNTIFRTWSINPISSLLLTLYAEFYDLSLALVMEFGVIKLNTESYLQLAYLVQLLEGVSFLNLRIHLLQPWKYTSLIKTMYGILLLLPQGKAYNSLNKRMKLVDSIYKINMIDNNEEEEMPKRDVKEYMEVYKEVRKNVFKQVKDIVIEEK